MWCCGHALSRRDGMSSAVGSAVGAILAGCAGTRAASRPAEDTRADAAKIVGGNDLRIFAASAG